MNRQEKIQSILEEKKKMITGLNRSIWKYAEGGYQEYRSAAKIKAVSYTHLDVYKRQGFTRSIPA